MHQTTITISDDVVHALEAYRQDHPEDPSLTAVAQEALREYLALRGYLAPRRKPRFRPSETGSDHSTISVEHDRFFADQQG